MKKLLLPIFLFLTVLPLACTKIDRNIKLHINTNLMSSTVIINVANLATGEAIPEALKVKVRGADADRIYTFAGDRAYKYDKGKIVLAIRSLESSNEPASFTVSINGSGYLPVTTEISVPAGQPHYETSVGMLDISAPPAGIAIKTITMQVNSTGLTKTNIAQAKTSDSVYYDDELTSVVFPAGTKFYYYKDADGVPVASLKRTLETVNFTRINESFDLFEERLDSKISYTKTNYTGSIKAYYISATAGMASTRISVKAQDVATAQNASADPDLATIEVLKDAASFPRKNLALTSVAKAPLSAMVLVGTVSGEDVMLSPDNDFNWFVSFVVDENVINPITNKKIQDGDVVEGGITSNKTARIVVKKAGNGQLRAEARSNNIGFYRQAQLLKEYSYTLDGAPDSQVPDIENLLAKWQLSLSFDMGGMHVDRRYDMAIGGGTNKTVTVQVASHDLAFENNLKQYTKQRTYYGSSIVNTQEGNNIYQSRPFNTANWAQGSLNPEITLDLTLRCGLDSDPDQKIVRPTGYFYREDNFSLSMKNGAWKTKCLKSADKLEVDVDICGKPFPISYQVSGLNIKDTLTSDNLCKCY